MLNVKLELAASQLSVKVFLLQLLNIFNYFLVKFQTFSWQTQSPSCKVVSRLYAKLNKISIAMLMKKQSEIFL